MQKFDELKKLVVEAEMEEHLIEQRQVNRAAKDLVQQIIKDQHILLMLVFCS